VKEILKQYAAYNVWANQRIIDVAKSLSKEDFQKPIKSSFPGVERTLLHIWDAESIWWQRLKLQEHITRPSEADDLQLKKIIAGISNQDKQWCDWISAATDAALNHVFAYQNTKKEQFKQPVNEMLIHLFNHTTYHRGQLITMFNQLNVEKIPATDFIVWSRGVK
jgi:uncharacterized damage-inducible protein DinB